MNPDLAEAYYNRGKAYGKKGRLLQAISDFTKAIKINPDLAEAYFNRGDAYADQGNFAQAIFDYNKAIEINPNYAESYSNRGDAYNRQGNLSQAVSDYTKAIEINPNDTKAYNSRVIIYYKLGKNDESLADKPGETQTFTGTVAEILFNSDPTYGNRSEIMAIDDKGQKISFIVRTGLSISSSSNSEKTYTLKTLKKGDNVTIEYTTNREGLNKVMTIKLTVWGM
jgi:tetratricopeptide (TPR) repeat protein